MTSKEYLAQLEHFLKKLSDEEREDAINYYTEYFEEAGPEREQEIIEALGNPKRLASTIRVEAAMRGMDEDKPKIRKGMNAVWLTILGIFAAPIALPIAIAIFAVVLAVLISVGAVFISMFAAAFACIASGIFLFITSFPLIFQSIPTSMFYLGSGIFLSGFGLLFGYGMYLLTSKTFKGLVRLVSNSRNRFSAKKDKENIYQPYPPAEKGEIITTDYIAEPANEKKNKDKWIVRLCAIMLVGGLVIGGFGFGFGGMQSISLGSGGIKIFNDSDGAEWTIINQTYKDDEIDSINIDLSNIGKVRIEKGSSFTVDGKNRKQFGGLYADVSGGKLTVGSSENKSPSSILFNIGPDTWGNNNGYLTITVPNDSSMDNIDINLKFGDVYLTSVKAGDYTVDVSNGDLSVKDLEAHSFKTESSFGDIEINGIKADSVTAKNSNGDVKLSDAVIENSLNVKSSFGDIKIKDITSGSAEINTSNGDIIAEGFRTTDLISKTSFGDLKITGLLKGTSDLSTSNGNVTLKLDNKEADTSVEATTTAGDTQVNGNRSSGGYTSSKDGEDKLKVSTSFGDIKINLS